MRRKLHDAFQAIDYVPPSLPMSTGAAHLYTLEDNDAVIKMTIKGRSPNLRHVARTHRVDLDWLFERIRKDPGIFVKFVGTKEQCADILTKGSFTAEAWDTLMNLVMILPMSQSLPGKPSNSKQSFQKLCIPIQSLCLSAGDSMASKDRFKPKPPTGKPSGNAAKAKAGGNLSQED